MSDTAPLELRWGSVQLRLLPVVRNGWEVKLGSRQLVVSMYAPGFWVAVITSTGTRFRKHQYQSRGTDDTPQRALDELRGEMRVELEAMRDAMGVR